MTDRPAKTEKLRSNRKASRKRLREVPNLVAPDDGSISPIDLLTRIRPDLLEAKPFVSFDLGADDGAVSVRAKMAKNESRDLGVAVESVVVHRWR